MDVNFGRFLRLNRFTIRFLFALLVCLWTNSATGSEKSDLGSFLRSWSRHSQIASEYRDGQSAVTEAIPQFLALKVRVKKLHARTRPWEPSGAGLLPVFYLASAFSFGTLDIHKLSSFSFQQVPRPAYYSMLFRYMLF